MMSKGNTLFDIHTPKGSVHHSRLRMGLSGLNAHRKKYNFITFNNCPLCGQKPEDTVHFLLVCPYLAMHRNALMGAITNLFITRIPTLNLTPNNKRGLKDLSHVLLYGSDALSYDENAFLFRAVHAYICDTKRFDID